MDVTTIVEEIEEALTDQLRIAGSDEAVVRAGEFVIRALEPAIERAAIRLAEQAAEEVEAQLPGKSVSVRLQEGTPVLTVEEDEEPIRIDTDELGARITLRLSDKLKGILEDFADESGDSLNTYVIKTLTSETRDRSVGQTFSGTIET